MWKISDILQELDSLKKAIRAIDNKQIFSKSVCERMHSAAQQYFAELRPALSQSDDVAAADKLFTQMHDLSRKSPSKQKCLDLLTALRRALVRVEGAIISQSKKKPADNATRTDNLIISTLTEVCPAGCASFQQALIDLTQAEKVSWRGTATELREALRETLDRLAPDKDVEAESNFKLETGANRPTMKQKVRYILKNRGMNSAQIATSEDTIKFVEESLGGITRSVYNRSSASTHTPTTREEVVRIHALVRLVLCELLAIPHT